MFSISLLREMMVCIALLTTAMFWERFWHYKAFKEHIIFSGSESFMLIDIVFILETGKYLEAVYYLEGGYPLNQIPWYL